MSLSKKCRELKVQEALHEHREADRHERGEHATESTRREKRIRKLKQKADRIEEFLQENEPKKGSGGKEIQSNVTDNESAKMATSHGVVQGYNANAIVDEKHQVVLHGEAFGKGEDSTVMGTMLEGAKERLEAAGREEPLKGVIVSADTGFYSVKNLEDCKGLGVDAYVPDPQFRKRDVRFENADRHRRSVDKRHEK